MYTTYQKQHDTRYNIEAGTVVCGEWLERSTSTDPAKGSVAFEFPTMGVTVQHNHWSTRERWTEIDVPVHDSVPTQIVHAPEALPYALPTGL